MPGRTRDLLARTNDDEIQMQTPEERLGRTLDPTRPRHGKVAIVFMCFAVFGGIACITVPYFLLCIILLPWRPTRIRIGNWIGKMEGKWAYFILGLSHEVIGVHPPESAPAIYVQNHGGTVDLFLAMQMCPPPGSGTVKREIIWIPFIGLGYLLSGHLVLTRQKHGKAMAAMAAMVKLVRRHRVSIWIFPEGTRSKDGKLGPFKKGFVHLAIDTRLPVIPVVVHRAPAFWPRGMQIRPGRVIVETLDPIPTDDWTRENLVAHVEQVRSIFLEHLGETD